MANPIMNNTKNKTQKTKPNDMLSHQLNRSLAQRLIGSIAASVKASRFPDVSG